MRFVVPTNIIAYPLTNFWLINNKNNFLQSSKKYLNACTYINMDKIVQISLLQYEKMSQVPAQTQWTHFFFIHIYLYAPLFNMKMLLFYYLPCISRYMFTKVHIYLLACKWKRQTDCIYLKNSTRKSLHNFVRFQRNSMRAK